MEEGEGEVGGRGEVKIPSPEIAAALAALLSCAAQSSPNIFQISISFILLLLSFFLLAFVCVGYFDLTSSS